ncbi:MAG: preprotein translocase subunit SecA [Candidatus Pacebacteria bacterium]|nr:preprotein translocase subunit SecA [Candidatus Paceibacterota bacterium]
MSFLGTIFGTSSSRALKAYYPLVEKINLLEPRFAALSSGELAGVTADFKKRLAEAQASNSDISAMLEEILPEAFAAVREAAKRTLGQRHFDVQLIGGAILHRGNISEMKTGEGKTLVATLPAYLNALTGKGVHIVTVNDYLSRRDATWMGQIYAALGLSVGVINHESSFLYDASHKTAEKVESDGETADKTRDELGSFKVVYEFLRPCGRPEAYAADITYGTNNEFGFDYLRDNIEQNPAALRQRGFCYAIVDEIDSILIDEARTPLIISMPTTDSEDLYGTFAKIASKMEKDVHYEVDEKMKSATLTPAGIEQAEKALGIDNIYTEKGMKYVHHLETAVRAKALYQREKAYIVKDNEVLIVDEFTGRLQPGRRWSEGLHQAIEAKEGVKVQKESRTYASITFQNYFRMYDKLSGMTGTAATSSEEFYKVYGLDVIEVPTNKKIARLDKNDLIFQTEKGKFMAIANRIKELNQKGQPVLVGTVSIEKNELLSQYLSREGVKHQMLNAKPQFAEKEGEIVAGAGKKGAVTIATNMAGRGVDIKLGGPVADATAAEEIKALGGLYVIGTERHEARRIDNQLRGRSGRQGDPGETQFFVSLEDDLMRIFATDTIKKMMGRFGIPEDQPIENYLITRSLETAQSKIEGFNFDARKHVLEYDDVLNYQRLIIYKKRRAILVGGREEIDAALNEMIELDIDEERRATEKAAMEKKKTELGDQHFYISVKGLLLQTIDLFWVDHLEMMEYMRSSVNLRAYGQRDPLVEYKKEGLKLFKEMEQSIASEVLQAIPNILGDMGLGFQVPTIEIGPDFGQNVGRNDPCPCGSGKKYKKCHGKNDTI